MPGVSGDTRDEESAVFGEYFQAISSRTPSLSGGGGGGGGQSAYFLIVSKKLIKAERELCSFYCAMPGGHGWEGGASSALRSQGQSHGTAMLLVETDLNR
jgi:hypothetical protein